MNKPPARLIRGNLGSASRSRRTRELMDKSAVEAIIERELKPLCDRLGLSYWDLDIKYGPIDGSGNGQCARLMDYDRATIEFNPEQLDDEAHVLKVLRHELFHIIHSPFDLYSCAVDNAGLGKTMDDVLDRIWRHACEKTVINLERMFNGLTDKPPESPTVPVSEPDGPPAIS
jgi:hypothetical protein